MILFEFFKYKPPGGGESVDFPFEQQAVHEHKNVYSDAAVSDDINKNYDIISRILHTDINGDVVIRWFNINTPNEPIRGFVLSVDGLSSDRSINDFVLEPLMSAVFEPDGDSKNISTLADKLIPQMQVVYETNLLKLADSINFGNAAFFVDGFENAIIFDVKSWEHRSVDTPLNEAVVQGPHEAFNEMLRCNTALIRKTINNSSLIMDTMFFGNVSKTRASLAYIDGVINPELLSSIKAKLGSIDMDYVLSVFDIEKAVEERPLLPMPQVITTERPDKVSRALIEGRAALILSGSSYALIFPSNITDILASPEDAYLRLPYSVFIKLVRLLAVILSLLTPGLYLAVTGHHTDAILTDMLIALRSAGNNIPFTPLTEVIIMEISFELIKEAGVRIPGAIGSSLGIVGGLILGQSAVSAGLVSPIIIIIVSVCGIASFAIPSYSLSFSFRISRFAYIFAGAYFGIIGIISIMSIHLALVLGTKSFGIPACVPFAPKTSKYPAFHAIFDTHSNVSPPEYMKAAEKGGKKNEL